MAATEGPFGIEEIDSPIQRVVARKRIFFVVPIFGLIIAFALLAWETVRRNLPPDVAKQWPWRLELLDYQSASTILTVLAVVVLTRMQYAETVRPVLGWTLLPTAGNHLPIKNSASKLYLVNAFNSGNGVAVFDSIHYRIAFTSQREPTHWMVHSELYAALESQGLHRNRDFSFTHLRAGFPLMSGESLLDKDLMIALLSRDAIKKFRILDIRLRFKDQLGDLHERVLPCRAVFTVEVEPEPTRSDVRAEKSGIEALIQLLKRRR